VWRDWLGRSRCNVLSCLWQLNRVCYYTVSWWLSSSCVYWLCVSRPCSMSSLVVLWSILCSQFVYSVVVSNWQNNYCNHDIDVSIAHSLDDVLLTLSNNRCEPLPCIVEGALTASVSLSVCHIHQRAQLIVTMHHSLASGRILPSCFLQLLVLIYGFFVIFFGYINCVNSDGKAF